MPSPHSQSPRGLLTRARGRRPLVLAGLGLVLLAALLGVTFGASWSSNAPWYESEGWTERTRVVVPSEQIGDDLRGFPVSVDLGQLSSGFWDHVAPGCGDVRVTTSDGQTELPRQILSCDVVPQTGELRFVAPRLAERSDTRFYLYHGNPDATDYPDTHRFGAQALAPWADGSPASPTGIRGAP